MSNNNLLFQIHKDQLMDFEEWKAIGSKEVKAELLQHWRTLCSDEEIRNRWNVKPPAFYYHLKTLNLSTRSPFKKPTEPESPAAHRNDDNPSFFKFEIEGNYGLIERNLKNILTLIEDRDNTITLTIEVKRPEVQD